MKKIRILLIIISIIILTYTPSFASNHFVKVGVGYFKYNEKFKIGQNITLLDKGSEIKKFKDIEILIRNKSNIIIFENAVEREFKINLEDLSLEGDINLYGKKYRGQIRFLENGRIINFLDIEDYLKGVVPREMSPSFPEEALKAQILASRTFTKTNLKKHENEGFNLCNTTHCQVYEGINVEDSRVNKLINETDGELVYYNGDLAETLYHSTNGGYMEGSLGAWGGDRPYLKAREDIYSIDTPHSEWTLEYTVDQIENLLRKSGIDVGNILKIEIKEKTEGQRVRELEIIGSQGREKITGNRFRNILDPSKFKSNYFTIVGDISDANKKLYSYNSKKLGNNLYIQGYSSISIKNVNDITVYKRSSDLDKVNLSGGILIVGKGFGHGVGMSQYGASNMAKKGFNYKEILKYYYPGVEIY